MRYLITLGLAAVVGCGSSIADPLPPCNSDVCEVTGRVTWINLEGGFFAIVANDSVAYDTHNLPAAFRQDGVRVAATLRRRLDLGCIHMAGPIADVLSIRRL